VNESSTKSSGKGGSTRRIAALTAFANAVVSRFMIIALTFLGARYLSADHFGVFALIMSAASSVATLSGVGVGVVNNTTASRHYDDDPNFVSAVFTGILLVCLILSLAFALTFLPLIDVLDSGFSATVLLCILFVVSGLMTVASASEGLAYGIRRTGTMLIISLIVLLIAPVASVWFMITWGLNGAIAALVLFRSLQSGMLFAALTLSTRIRITPIRAWQDRVRLSHVFLGTSLPLAGAAVLAAPVTTFAMFLLQQQVGAEQVGAFALAYQVFLMLVFPPGAMGHFLVSQLAAKGANSKAILRRMLVYFTGYGMLGWGLMSGITFIIPLITQTVVVDFALMATFGAAVLFYTISIGFNNYWSSIGRARMVFIGQIGWAAPILLVTFFGATTYGALALVVGFVVGAMAQLSIHITFFLLKKET
jgi:O-antigen/teichoic acid export membrane protein|tara:strand:- start:3266 stop:4531 length:1266 start_codon:yes stop_codon:yes gene_type:complete